jgi:hypothetical protein
MDKALSFVISVGIVAFGIWVVVSAIKAGAPLAWPAMGLLPIFVGSASLYVAAKDA